MAVALHIVRLRQKVGHELLLLPSVAVLPLNNEGRVLLVRQRDFGTFGTVGGAIDENEAPLDAAHREAREEIGVEVEITGLVGAVGGPQFRLTYPNGDQTAYVTIVYEARVSNPAAIAPDGDEVDAVSWFRREDLGNPQVGRFATETFKAIGWL